MADERGGRVVKGSTGWCLGNGYWRCLICSLQIIAVRVGWTRAGVRGVQGREEGWR